MLETSSVGRAPSTSMMTPRYCALCPYSLEIQVLSPSLTPLDRSVIASPCSCRRRFSDLRSLWMKEAFLFGDCVFLLLGCATADPFFFLLFLYLRPFALLSSPCLSNSRFRALSPAPPCIHPVRFLRLFYLSRFRIDTVSPTRISLQRTILFHDSTRASRIFPFQHPLLNLAERTTWPHELRSSQSKPRRNIYFPVDVRCSRNPSLPYLPFCLFLPLEYQLKRPLMVARTDLLQTEPVPWP